MKEFLTNQILTENKEQGIEKDKEFYDGLSGLVKDVYCQRTGKGENDPLIRDNVDHFQQVKNNVDFIISELKSGNIKEGFLPKDQNGQVTFDERLLKTMAVLHDVAKLDDSGKLDTFGHHDRNKLMKLLGGNSPINNYLKDNGFDDEEVNLMINGIEAHSRRTDFIQKKFIKEGKDLSTALPRPEGVLENVILSDADILTQSKLEQGVKKIVCSRLMFEGFRKEDETNGRHSFAKTLESAVDSARKVSEVMHFDVTRKKTANQISELQEFVDWLNANDEIKTIDKLDDFIAKKAKFDQLMGEFLLKNRF